MIRIPVCLMLCILFSIAFLTACAAPIPMPTITPILPTPTPTLEPSPTASSINEMPMIERVSVASDGTPANCDAVGESISSDGRYVAFLSCATNLVEGVTYGNGNIYVHDRVTGGTTLVSVSSDGTPGNNGSSGDCISANGRYVAFMSEADNLVEGDTNGLVDCFVHDLVTGETTRVSVASDGTQANGACEYIGMWFWRTPSISADGRYVAFHSDATNLVEGDTNGVTDIYVHDRVTVVTTLVSISSDGTQGNGGSSLPSISTDGRYVTFSSDATNLVVGVTNGGIFLYDRLTGETTLAAASNDWIQGNIDFGCSSISADGRYEAFHSGENNLVEGDTEGTVDVFVRYLGTGK